MPCSGNLCNLDTALFLFVFIGIAGGIGTTALLIKTVKVKEGTAKYLALFIFNIIISIGIVVVINEVLRQEHVSLFPAIFYWYIPPS